MAIVSTQYGSSMRNGTDDGVTASIGSSTTAGGFGFVSTSMSLSVSLSYAFALDMGMSTELLLVAMPDPTIEEHPWKLVISILDTFAWFVYYLHRREENIR